MCPIPVIIALLFLLHKMISMPRRFTESTLLIASHNAGKVKELQHLFHPYHITLVSAAELNIPEPEETGVSFMENAVLKAHYYSTASSLPALADDSGLAVDALQGRPGIHSARFAAEHSGFAGAMQQIERLLAGENNQTAAFICALSLWWPGGDHEEVEARLEGELCFPPRGDKGFGYDPIFVPQGCSLSCAEMEPNAKNAISHRAIAFTKLIERCFA